MVNERNGKAKPLSPKQETFVRLVALEGLNATRAYVGAYGASVENADANSHRLMGNEGVKGEIQRLKALERRKLEQQALFTKEQALEFLRGVIEATPDQIDESSPYAEIRGGKLSSISKIAAVQEMARMLGWHKAEAVNHTVAMDFRAVIAALPPAEGFAIGTDRREVSA